MNCIPFITVTLLMNRKDEKLKPNTFEYIYMIKVYYSCHLGLLIFPL